MLEPFLTLTVLNCFFMFSSTMTTCALWWQYRKHRHSCSSHSSEASKLKLKKSKSCEDRSLRDGKKCCMRDIISFVGSKSSVKRRGKSTSRIAKESKKDKKIKSSSGASKRPRSKEAKYHNVKCLEKLTSTEDMRHGATSRSSDAKSTVVMEVSTVQKVVQIFDNDRDYQQAQLPNETMTYRFSPETQRKVEFVVKSKSEDKSKSMEKVDNSDNRA